MEEKMIMTKLEELEGQIMTKEKLESTLEEFKAVSSGEMQKKLDMLMQELASIKASKGEIFATEADLEGKRHQEVFERYLKKGDLGLTPEERKTMTSNDDTTGGYLAGRQLDKNVIKTIREMNSMMDVAMVKQTSSKVYTFIRVANMTAAGTVQEGIAGTVKDVTFEKIDINTYVFKHTTYITEEDIEDAEINITNIVTEQIAEGLAEGAEDKFFTGTGVNEPSGVLTNVTITAAAVETKSSGTFIGDDIISLTYALKKGYRKNHVYFANRAIIGHMAQMKDGAGRFQFSLEPLERFPGSIAQLMGRPLYEAPSMASTVVAGNYVLAVGDFSKGYCIVERIGTTVKRDDVTKAEEGVVKYIGRKRLGGMVVQPEAIKLLKVKA